MPEGEHVETLEEIRNERIAKGERLVEQGQLLYPNTTTHTHTLLDVRTAFDDLEKDATVITVVGRVMSIRTHGSSAFIDLFDGTATLQGYLKKDVLDDEVFELFVDTVDRGDFVELPGTVMRTKRGEPSLLAQSWRMLSKAILPIPTQHFGIKDEDERYRKRYLDILLNTELAGRFRRRSLFWNTFRTYLLERGYIEVETPILETMPGGAEARPFETHHNALDMPVYLRISVGELWQKKLMVAGLPKTFEIGRVFRNEGMSHEHAQDYTSCEFYEAYSDVEKGKVMIRELYITLAQKTFGTTKFSVRDHTFDLDTEWETYDYSDIIKEAYDFDPRDVELSVVLEALKSAGIHTKEGELLNKERAVDLLWKKQRALLSGPGFLMNVPVYMEPLAKKNERDPRVVDRFQVILAGSEVGKGFSELNDPIDQNERFAHQQALREAGDEEAQHADTEFVEALEYGMPPTFGFGTSERLFSMLEGVSVREAQLFPLMRPKNDN